MIRLASLLLLVACATEGDVRGPIDTAGVDEFEGFGFVRPDDDSSDIGWDNGDDTGGDTDTDTTPPAAGADEACYPGEDDAWATCLPLVEPTSMPAGYDYPDPLSGSAQYREPVAWLDLEALDPQAYLAPNFVLGEIAAASKGRYAVVQPHAVDALQGVRDEVGVLGVNSGYRSPAYNAGVGGVTWSRHMYGDAFDLDPGAATLEELAVTCEAHGAGYVGVYTSHIHCDWRSDPLSEAFFGPGWRSAGGAPEPVHDAWVERRGDELVAPALGWDEGQPLRVWTAYDAAGEPLETARGRSYAPPPGAVEVEVEIGMTLVRRIDLAP